MDKDYQNLVEALEKFLSENEMEIINDAIQCYGRHKEEHSYDEEIDIIRSMALAFAERGYNHVLPEFDITLH